MKVVWLLLLLMVGCTQPLTPPPNISFEEFQKLPRQWKAPVLYVRLPEEMEVGDIRIEYARALCKEFAIRLYDATDGQVYVPRFIICNPSLLNERDSGMCNLFKPGSLVYKNEAYIGTSPIQHPGRFYCEIPTSVFSINACAGIMLHEWFHTFVGLGDEYKHAGELGNTVTTGCPKQYSKDYCVMTESRVRRELCRPDDHNPDTDEGKESCWAKLARVLFENRIAYIHIPDKVVLGPLDPPTPQIDVILK